MAHTAHGTGVPIAANVAMTKRSFDYNGIDEKTRTSLRGDAEMIRRWTGEASQRILMIGNKLNFARTLLPHGQFGPWLAAEFGWSERTAQRYMQAAEVFGGKSDTVSVLEPTAVYALSAPSTPKAVREAVVTRLEAGERPALQEIKAEVATARKQVQQKKAEKKAAQQIPTGLPPVMKLAEVKGRDAAVFILMNLAERRSELLSILEGADAAALLETLRKGDMTPMKGVVQSFSLDD